MNDVSWSKPTMKVWCDNRVILKCFENTSSVRWPTATEALSEMVEFAVGNQYLLTVVLLERSKKKERKLREEKTKLIE